MAELHTLWVVLHIIGVVVGAGGAFVSDTLFFSSIKDRRLSKTEMRLLSVTSNFVWVGILIILASGAGLFLENIDGYIASSKFLVKMTIVAIIILNGAFFHYWHMPLMHNTKNADLRKLHTFKNNSRILFVSGGISFVSWMSAIVLGSLRSIPVTYSQGMWVYLGFIMLASFSALFVRHRIFR
jgi:uncharacterized membrane protein